MRSVLFFVLFLTPLQAQFYNKNPDLNQLKTVRKLPGVKNTYFRMALAHEVLYGTTDRSRIRHVYDAVIFLHKSVKPAEGISWTTIPKMRKSYRKNPEGISNVRFLNKLIETNIALRKALKPAKPEQRRQNLFQVYNDNPNNIPTLVAVVENEWALQNHAEGDRILRRLLAREPGESHWPILILKAKMTRRQTSIDHGLNILLQAWKLHFSKDNPAAHMIEVWAKEIKDGELNAQALHHIRAVGELASQAKKNKTGMIHYYYGKLMVERGELAKGIPLLTKALRKDSENCEFFKAWAEANITWDIIGKKVKKQPGPSTEEEIKIPSISDEEPLVGSFFYKTPVSPSYG